MEGEEKIVVLETFDNPGLAGIAKSKLDAFGIPCFLSEEHMGTLYPFSHAGFSGIRLHVFEKDKHQAKEILDQKEM